MSTVVIFALSVTVYEIFTVKIYVILILTFEWVKVKYKYTIRKSICDFPFIEHIRS